MYASRKGSQRVLLKLFCKTFVIINKEEISKLKDHLETIEYDIAAVNALELTCTEHLERYRALQEVCEGLKAETEGEGEEEL